MMLSRSGFRKSVITIGAGALLLGQPAAAFAQTAAAVQSFNAPRFEGQTQVERTMGRCVVAVAGGALVGAFLGGRRNAGRGALIGAGAGIGICAYMMSVASARDKERLRELQLQAMNSGQTVQDQWQTSDGKMAAASITTSKVVQVSATKSADVLNCRRATTHLSVNGQTNDSSDVVCLHGDSWVTLDKLKSMGINVGDVAV